MSGAIGCEVRTMTLRMRSVVMVIVRAMDRTMAPRMVRSPERALRISEFF
jgi:hypothetical protein